MAETVETSPPEDEASKYDSLLATGERVLLVRQRHWLTFLQAARWFVLALGLGIAALVLDQAVGFLGSLLDWAFWIFLTIGLLGVAWYFLAWRNERYLVTTRRVIESGGVINKYARDTSLQMISDMIVERPWLGRIAGYGELVLLTPSEAGTSKIRFLPDADGFKKVLLDARHELELELGGGRAASADLATQPASTSAALSVDELDSTLGRLADLRDRGLITQDEFDEKKSELLDRL